MSLISALNIGTSGMQAESTDLSVIGDNISNANTIGFKASRTDFEEQLMSQLVGGVGINGLGMGTNVQAIQKLLTQGTLTSTGVATDLALQGNGMFVVKGNHNGMAAQYYTRNGQFTVDNDGFLVNQEGLRVQGYTTNPATGAAQPGLGDMQVGNINSPAGATSQITLRGNLNANAATPANGTFDPNDPTSYNGPPSTIQIYDSLGNSHDVTVYYVKTATGWTYHAVTDGGGLTGGTAGVQTEIASGDLTFGTDGSLTGITNQTSNFNPLNATNPQPLNFNFGTPPPAGTGMDGMTQLGTNTTADTSDDVVTSFTDQDGHTGGTLSSISIDANGHVTAAFSNGQTETIAEVAVAEFAAPDQLNRAGGNLYQATAGSGEATIGEAGTGGRGSIVAGALEQSNVDLANEFVKMIAAQRGFEANSKTITTADQLLTELMQLKR
ncbi:MAG: flagellar hook protein FlgE [Myxococcaceae bacterium]